MPLVPQHPHPVQRDRSVGEGLPDRHPTQGRRMVAPTNYGAVAKGCAGAGEKALVTLHTGLIYSMVTRSPVHIRIMEMHTLDLVGQVREFTCSLESQL